MKKKEFKKIANSLFIEWQKASHEKDANKGVFIIGQPLKPESNDIGRKLNESREFVNKTIVQLCEKTEDLSRKEEELQKAFRKKMAKQKKSFRAMEKEMEALRESERKLRSDFDGLKGIVVWMLNLLKINAKSDSSVKKIMRLIREKELQMLYRNPLFIEEKGR